jgi:hypothetical protein
LLDSAPIFPDPGLELSVFGSCWAPF